MTRELKLALIVGFSLVLIVTVLVSDHLSKARRQVLASPQNDLPLAMQPMPVQPPALTTNDEPPLFGPARASAEVQPVAIEPKVEPVPEPTVINLGTANRTRTAQGSPATPTNHAGEATKIAVAPPIRDPLQNAVTERTHLVADGETLFQISKKYYGNGNSWTKIAQHNGIRAEAIKPGMKLRLPGLEDSSLALAPADTSARAVKMSAKSPDATKSADAVKGPKYNLYTVKPGDTLAKISRKMLGSPERLADLLRLNDIEDGDTLNIGQTIKIPLS